MANGCSARESQSLMGLAGSVIFACHIDYVLEQSREYDLALSLAAYDILASRCKESLAYYLVYGNNIPTAVKTEYRLYFSSPFYTLQRLHMPRRILVHVTIIVS